MTKRILVIDDEKDQAEATAKLLNEKLSSEGYCFVPLYTEEEILRSVSEELYSLAIIDIRMDDFAFDGFSLCQKIIESNPLAKVIIVSSFLDFYKEERKEIVLSGYVIDVLEKKSYNQWIPELTARVKKYFDEEMKELSLHNNVLFEIYAAAKNEKNAQKKGKAFEDLLVLLFTAIGFKYINDRCKDLTSETDLVIRNDIDDSFLYKFGKYILVEAKNYPVGTVGKNDFLQLLSKVESTNKMCELGVLATTGNIAKTVRLEALRTSKDSAKILLLTNNEILRLIESENKLNEFKMIIDEQVKDTPV